MFSVGPEGGVLGHIDVMCVTIMTPEVLPPPSTGGGTTTPRVVTMTPQMSPRGTFPGYNDVIDEVPRATPRPLDLRSEIEGGSKPKGGV